jgi:hypothetical protein
VSCELPLEHQSPGNDLDTLKTKLNHPKINQEYPVIKIIQMEQENLFPELPVEKLYRPLNIYVATLFGGPLVAGYLIAANYKALNESRNVARTWIFTIIGTVLIIVFAYVIESRSTRNVPGYIISIIYSVIIYNIVNLVQKPKIINYISAGGQFHPASRVLLVTIIGVVITFLILLIVANFFDFYAYSG